MTGGRPWLRPCGPPRGTGLWRGVTEPDLAPGALVTAEPERSPRHVYLLQRTPGRIGNRLGLTTGWVHRAASVAKGVEQIAGVGYDRIDDAELDAKRTIDQGTRVAAAL